jgi:ABC-2 type transport system ATP-binding protein
MTQLTSAQIPEIPPRREPGGIDAHGLSRSFGDVKAVQEMSLSVPPGQVTALVGPNGSGKTTLMLVLATLLRPDAGFVTVDGIDAMRDPQGARRRIGWMPDTLGVWESLTCLEILGTMGRLYGMSAAEADARAAEQLEWVQLTEFARRPARVLSRGQQQRLSLARATVHRPSVLLLDEPANGLDPGSRIRLRDDVRQMAAAGVAVLVSSHVLGELEEMSDRAVFVREGSTVSTADLSDTAGHELRYRIAGPDPAQGAALMTALEQRGVAYTHRSGRHRDGVVVSLAGRQAAAGLLADLVGAGVPIAHFAQEGSRLEDAYLAMERPPGTGTPPAGPQPPEAPPGVAGAPADPAGTRSASAEAADSAAAQEGETA